MNARIDRGAGLALFAAGFAGVFAPLARRGADRRREMGLAELDDRSLADIGIDRAEIARARRIGTPFAPMSWHG
jgi:hypothetical protein